jgi:ABC-type lipoprotein release transport system permease subunit
LKQRQLVLRGLSYYWRTNAAVVLGVATAVAVLAGALLVGDSVRGSLRDLVVQRLGRTDRVVMSSGFFREALADNLRADEAFASSFASICPMIAAQGLVSDPASGRRASRVQVYGVDDRFSRFHGTAGVTAPRDRDAFLSPALASDIGVAAGGSVLLRVERPSAIPIESLHGRKDNMGRTLPVTVRGILAPADLGEFSLQPQQREVRAVFVPLLRLQRDLGLTGRVNVLLVSDRPSPAGGATALTRRASRNGELERLIRRQATLEDVGLTLRVLEAPHELALESPSGLIDDVRANAAAAAAIGTSMTARPVLTYLANTLKSGARQVPYSLVTAIELRLIAPLADIGERSGAPPIVVNDWTARDLGVGAGDPLTLEYYVWEEPGRLLTRSADFRIAAIVPIAGAAADRDLAPVYPGLTDARSLVDWDPPFPFDLRRIRRIDEDYWDRYRTTPKGFIPIEVGQALWRSRYGDRTSVRLVPEPGRSPADAHDRYAARLRATIDPVATALSVRDVRAEGLAASRGATDFGEYFTYFSFFLVMSAVMLAALFFRLGVEQRVREVGLLRAVGFTTAGVRRLFACEGLALATIGSAVGICGAVGYGAVMMLGLRTWWAGAVGTPSLSLHVAPSSLAAGAASAFVIAVGCIWWTLRGLARISERSLLAGQLAGDRLIRGTPSSSGALAGAIGFGGVGAALMAATLAGVLDRTGAFFGAGTSFLVAWLFLIAFILRRPARTVIEGRGWWPVTRLGLRNARDRPGRSVLAIAVIASAAFILISVDAFRREGPSATDRHSGVGGYSLLVELMLPIVHDPGSREVRDALGLRAPEEAAIEAFRVLPGDDASCLNLYEPTRPRLLGASRQFIASGRFAFEHSLASSDAERANPWLILDRRFGDGIVPVVADANSMTYVLHKTLGEDIVLDGLNSLDSPNRGGRPVRLRLVAALADSILQSELVMSDTNFVRLFPEQEGYRFLLVETPPDRAAPVAAAIAAGGADLGADVVPTVQRLAEFHRVENTYLSTFQALGALGLLVGTVGLAAVVLRNVLERRRELALLGASGYRRAHIFVIVLAENALLLAWGLAVGALCALVAIAPAVADRGGRLRAAGGSWLLAAVLVAGLLSSVVATRAALRAPLLDALRAE